MKWLEEKQAIMLKPGGTVPGDQVEEANSYLRLKFGSLKTCEAATWRHLATVEAGELKWRNPAAAEFWKEATAAHHMGLVLVVDDFYRVIDAKAAAIVAAGDEVIDAAKGLGFADFKAAEKTLADLSKDTSGGPLGAVKPRLVTLHEAGKYESASVPPGQLEATMRKLVNDGPTLGDAIVSFRLAVLDLYATLGALGQSDAYLKTRGVIAGPALKNFTSGLPADFVEIEAVRANALAEEKYASALGALVGPGSAIKTFEDQGLRNGALLDPVDLALRNLVAIRSAEVDHIHAAAKARLKGKSIALFGVAARIATEAAKQEKSSLSEAVVLRLADSAEYQQLDALYENNKARRGEAWAKGPDGIAMARARDQILEAASSAEVVTNADGSRTVVYTQNDKKIAVTGVVPSAVLGNPAVRRDVAGIISRFIVQGSHKDARNQAMWAAIGGAGQPGRPLDVPLTGPERDLARDLPPEVQKIRAGAAGCESPKDMVRNDYETYAARKREAAASMAGENLRSRNDVEKKRLERLAAADLVCKQEKAAAETLPQDYFDDPALAADERRKAVATAEADCVKKKEAIEVLAREEHAKRTAAEGAERDHKKLRTTADEELELAFKSAILRSVATLRREYATAGSPRLRALSEATGASPKLPLYTQMWFDLEWPQDASMQKELQSAVSSCAKELGFGDASDAPAYQNPEKTDVVDKSCKIRENLTKYITASRESNRLVR
ncbi:MAG: hypothetical protein Q8T11_10465 [Elusimicrobiota bacterium]|nr:hypothetical protein [Elusimicrobiota bacterium]